MKILITGNIGSGKSTFLKFLKQYVDPQFYEFVDADSIAKQIILEKKIPMPVNRTEVFENLETLYGIEKQVIPYLFNYVPQTSKTLIMEASTLIECPVFLDKEDLVIHVSSKNSVAQTLARDKVENRAALVSRVQVTPWIKSLISDIEIINDSTLEDFEEKAKHIAKNLNNKHTIDYYAQIKELEIHWKQEFGELPWINSIVEKYSAINREKYNYSYLIGNITYLNHLEIDIYPLWKKAIYLATWFYKYVDDDKMNEKNIQALWLLAKDTNSFKDLIYGARSYISLACELLYAAHTKEPLAPNLNYSDGKLAHEIFYNLVNENF